jgi:hypothetical protein
MRQLLLVIGITGILPSEQTGQLKRYVFAPYLN